MKYLSSLGNNDQLTAEIENENLRIMMYQIEIRLLEDENSSMSEID